MSTAALAVITAAIFVWSLVSGWVARADLTAPIVFLALGALLHATLGSPEIAAHDIKVLTEIALVWVLFSDASTVRLRAFRRDLGLYGRLLGFGLPLTVVAGWLLAWALLSGHDLWFALLVGAALAPTDAALGSAVITNRAVPEKIRRMVNVESGLNDGIVTPVVVLAIAGASTHETGAVHALTELLTGLGVGLAAGLLAGRLLRYVQSRGWVTRDIAGPGVLALALLLYVLALLAHGNGFVAAFVGGLAFGNSAGRRRDEDVRYVTQTGDLVSHLVWLLFGTIVFPILDEAIDWQVAVYAVLSLTVVRMAPVAVSLLGTHLTRASVLFVGWFGPRGLASIIFALLALEDLGGRADPAVAVIAFTVLVSVLAHGLSARPLAARYARSVAGKRVEQEK